MNTDRILAKFFIDEFENDPTSVAEWLDNEGEFEDEEERDAFIEEVRNMVRK